MPTIRSSLAAVLAVVAATGLLSSPSLAANWQQTSLPVGYQYMLAVSPTGQIFAFGGGSLQVSTDDGVSWSPVAPFLQHGYIRTLAFSAPDTMYASDFAQGVFRSTNGGLTWSTNLVDEGCAGLAAGPGGMLYAGLTYTGNGRVHRSTDGGVSWLGVELPGASHGFATECFGFGDGGEVYAGSIDGFFRSYDLGLTWEALGANLLGRHVRTLAVAANQDVYIETLYPSAFDGLYRSTDRGTTWQRVNGNAEYFSAMTGSPSGDLYGASEESVFRSSDAGVTWASSGPGIATNERLTSLVVTPAGHLLAGGGKVWRTAAAVVGVEPPATRPGSLALSQNQPNPVSGVTRVRFTLARAAAVDLAIFDMAGRRVATLAQGLHEAREHSVSFDASALPAGVYAYRLVADGVARSRRMVVSR